MTDRLAHLAPTDQDTHALEESECERPHGPGGLDALQVAIGDIELALCADGAPDLGQLLVSGRLRRARAHEQGGAVEFVAQIRRENGADLCEHVARGLREFRISAIGYPPRAENQRLDLLFGKHERWQHESRFQYVAHAGLAV